MIRSHSMDPLKLSVIIIAKNEEHDIEECLQSVKSIANEIIVVDSGSHDKTVEISKRLGARVFDHEWTGFSAQKQFALDQASGPWVLNIDADERVSHELALEIRQILQNPSLAQFNGFEIPFKNFFFGQRLRFGSGMREKHIRLFQKDKTRYGQSTIHEGVMVAPPIGVLSSAIHHISYKDLSEYMEKCNFYTSLIAKEKFEKGRRFHFWHHLRLPYEFFVRYFLKGGFLDGNAGFVYALLSSYYVWMKYMKLKDLEEAQS